MQLHLGVASGTWLLCLFNSARHSHYGLFSPSVAYVLLLGLFHLGRVGLAFMGIDHRLSYGWGNSAYLPIALALCGMAFSFFASGSVLARLRCSDARGATNPWTSVSPRGTQNQRLFLAGLGVGAMGLCLLAAGVHRLGLFSVTYAASWTVVQSIDPRLFGVGLSLAFMGMVISAVGATKRGIRYVALLFGLALAPLAAYGFRGHFVVYFAALLLVWYQKDPRIAGRATVVFVLLVFVFAPTIVLIRSHQAASLSQAVQQARLYSLVAEMGGTMEPLVETVGAIEEGDTSYWRGRSYALAIGRVIPNVSWVWRAPASRGQDTPTEWLAARIRPWVFKMGGAAGFSGIAEPYLNFGVVGVISFFVLLGYVLMRCEALGRQNVYLTAVVMCAMGGLLWTTRNDFANFVRPAVWGACVVYLAKALPRRRSRTWR